MKQRVDADHDGRVEAEEKEHAVELARERFGTNWDRKSTVNQVERERREWMRREMFKQRVDTDHDGRVEAEEKEHAVELARERFGGPRFQHPDFNRPNLGPGEGRGLHRGKNPLGPVDQDYGNPKETDSPLS